MAMLFLSHRPPRGLLRFFRWPAMHVNWLLWCRPLPACKHWPMDLCPSAGDGVTEARRPTRRLIGGFAGRLVSCPGHVSLYYLLEIRGLFGPEKEKISHKVAAGGGGKGRFLIISHVFVPLLTEQSSNLPLSATASHHKWRKNSTLDGRCDPLHPLKESRQTFC